MRISPMRASLAAFALVALAPAYASAQATGTPPTAAGRTAPSGTDTPVAAVPGGPPVSVSSQSSIDAPLPTVDSSGANRSRTSTTGEAKAPIGAPRLPGEPSNPPTGPDD
jgi:hypothetical protein